MIRHLEHQDRSLYLTLLANFSLMGGVVTLFGAALSKVIATYGWSYTDAGTVYAAASIGFFTSSLIAGFLIDHFGSKPVIVVGLTAEAISLMFFARSPSVLLNVVLYFIIGLGLGSNEAITNSVVVRIEERGKSRLMNLIHAFWCVGAFVGPLGVANLIRSRVDWRIVFPTFGVLILIMTALLLFRQFPKPIRAGAREAAKRARDEAQGDLSGRAARQVSAAEPNGGAAEARRESRTTEVGAGGVDTGAARRESRAGVADQSTRPGLLRRFRAGTLSFVLLCALSIFVYIGVEKGVYSWVSVFFVRVLHSPVSMGAAMVGLYWVGQFLGRLAISVVYRGTRIELVFLLLSVLTVVSLLALAYVRVTWLAIACTFIAGVANSGIFPLVISLTGKYSASGRAVGLVTSAGGIAGFLFPIMVATISDAYGIATGFETVFYISVALLAVTLVVVVSVRRRDRAEAEATREEARIA